MPLTLPAAPMPRPPAALVPTPPGGLPEDGKRINPTVLLITLLDDLNITQRLNNELIGRMTQLLSRMERGMQRVPQGVVEVFDSLTVNAGEQVFDTVSQTEQVWFSATVYNAGPDDIQVRANDGFPWETPGVYTARKARYITLASGESVDLDFHAPLLRYIYYKLASGSTSANLKIVGEW